MSNHHSHLKLTNCDHRYVLTPIIPEPVQHYLKEQGVGFATTEDASKAMLLIASDPSINGVLPVTRAGHSTDSLQVDLSASFHAPTIRKDTWISAWTTSHRVHCTRIGSRLFWILPVFSRSSHHPKAGSLIRLIICFA